MKIGKLQVDWSHGIATALVVIYGLDQYLAGPQGAPVTNALHIPTSLFATVGFVIVLLSKSIWNVDPSQPTASKKSAGFARASLLVALSFVALLSVPVAAGCGWLGSGGGAVVAQQAEAELECVLAQVLAGGNVPLDVLVNCAGGAFSALFADLKSLVTYYLTGVGDAGGAAAGASQVCAAPGAKPPAPNVPACIPSAALAVLQAKHEEARARLEGGAK